MSQKIRRVILIVITVLILVGTYLIYEYVDLSSLNIPILDEKLIIVIIGLLLLVIVFYINNYLHNRKKVLELRYRDKLFNSLVKNSNTAYFMYDNVENKIIYMTKNIEEVLGISGIDTEEKGLEIINDILEKPIIKEEMRKWDEKSEFISQMVSYNHPNANGSKWIKVMIYPFIEKKASYQIILVMDVSKEYERQHLLIIQAGDIKTREKQLNQITSATYDVEMTVNIGSGEFRLRNLKPNDHYFGPETNGNYESEINSIIKEYVHEEDQEQILENLSLSKLRKMIEEKNLEPISIRYRLANSDEVTWLESTLFFITNKGDDYVVILTKNVTENAEYMRKQNALLQNALKEVERSNKAKSEFLTIMSHQIRTQMNAIIGLSESALSEDLSFKAREDVGNINSASKNLLEIIDGVLDISKVESGIIEKNEKEYDVVQLFRNLIGIANENINKKKLKLITKISPDIPRRLFGDSSKLRQIISNILDNAIQYTDKGVITFTVESKRKQQNVELIISIEDTGKGIEPDKLNKLFGDYDKENINHSENMGLSIVKRLIDLLNGQIVVESKVGEGSNFTVTITQKVIDEEAIGNIEEYITEKKKKDSFNAEGKSILVVDDNQLNIKVATRLLEPYNLNIESALSGQECIDLINSGKKYDLILLDQMMPEMDGIETLHELKKNSDFNTPVIVLTADAIVGVKEKYLNEGFNDYLSKPIDVKELNQLLKKYLRNRDE